MNKHVDMENTQMNLIDIVWNHSQIIGFTTWSKLSIEPTLWGFHKPQVEDSLWLVAWPRIPEKPGRPAY